MNRFLADDFLLEGTHARRLWFDYARDLPIIDYHCHLPVQDIAEDRVFENITQAWLEGDHYKWRAMRASGIPERLITGEASDREKFQAWAKTTPLTIGNPLYEWTHLELRRYFGIESLLDEGSAEAIWQTTGRLLASPGYSARGLLKRMGVSTICTTDDPIDPLHHHRALSAEKGLPFRVLPAFRPDGALDIGNRDAWNGWIERLGTVTDDDSATWRGFLNALRHRLEYFAAHGACISDHALLIPPAKRADESELQQIFDRGRAGQPLEREEVECFQTATLMHLGTLYRRHGWTMQLHIGALRDTNSNAKTLLGSNSGFDAIDDGAIARPLTTLLDWLSIEDALPQTILYALNPTHNEVIASIIGGYQDGETIGKIQFGSAWWFNDCKEGMKRQMLALANVGLLRHFVGMVTDSRSFLSFPRHEYFRRLLCSLIGGWVDAGQAPADMVLLGAMVKDICWGNAVRYFGFAKHE